jgi:hypothetical protein
MKLLLCRVAVSVMALAACSDGAKKMAEKQAALDKARAEKKAKDEASDLAPIPKETLQLEPMWNGPDDVVLDDDRPCPEGFWALFPGEAPGATKEEKKANAARRDELAKSAREKRYRVRLRSPDGVSLKPYDAPNGNFPLEVKGSLDCTDPLGHITLAWTKVAAVTPKASAAQAGSELVERIWQAEPLKWQVLMKSMAEARDFDTKNKLQLSARVVLRLGTVEVDKKLIKVGKVVEKVQGETLSIGGGTEDWGAGRMVRADLLGVRVATNREKTQLFEKRGN